MTPIFATVIGIESYIIPAILIVSVIILLGVVIPTVSSRSPVSFRILLFALTLIIAASSLSIVSGKNWSARITMEDKAMKDMGTLELLANTYFSRHHKFPQGTNKEIIGVMIWQDNDFHDPTRSLLINEIGEAIDPWKEPYVFGESEKHGLYVRSSGADRIPGTEDDFSSE